MTSGNEGNDGDPDVRRHQLHAAVYLARADLEGLHSQHANMWRLFTVHIRTLVTVLGGPVLLLSILISAGAIRPNADLSDLPSTVGIVLLASAVLASFLMHVLVRYRLDILMYARAINSLRRDYVRLLNTKTERIIAPAMPIRVLVPHNFEPLREVGLLVLVCSLITSFYFFLGAWIVTHHNWSGPSSLAAITFLVNYGAYILASRDRPVSGDAGFPTEELSDWRT
jgi:hypothetical protein